MCKAILDPESRLVRNLSAETTNSRLDFTVLVSLPYRLFRASATWRPGVLAFLRLCFQ